MESIRCVELLSRETVGIYAAAWPHKSRIANASKVTGDSLGAKADVDVRVYQCI